MSDPLDHPPTDHGSDRYDYVEIVGAPADVQPKGEWFDRLLAEACPDCRANVFITWAPQQAASWTVQIAHDETCPTPHLTEGADQ
jgi:hypothetical protein